VNDALPNIAIYLLLPLLLSLPFFPLSTLSVKSITAASGSLAL
jgi:hypothetical protein